LYSGAVLNAASNVTANYGWSVSCAGVIPVMTDSTNAKFDGKTPLAGERVRLELPQPKGADGNCTVSLRISGSDGLIRECAANVAVAPCDLGCTSEDLTELFFKLDGTLREQRILVTKAARLLRSITRNPKAAKDEEKKAFDAYGIGWSHVWSVPVLMNSCTNAAACITVSNADFIRLYEERALELDQLAKKVLAKAKGSARKSAADAGRTRRLRKQSSAAYAESLKESKKIPESQSSCS
jgi:hypothetical protein